MTFDPAPGSDAPAPMGAGVIGLGEIGQYHLGGFAGAPGVEIVGVADIDSDVRERSAHSCRATPYEDYRELLADPRVDMVSVCLPHAMHLPVALDSIRAGKHVLIEKPLAVTVQECDQIIDAAEQFGVTVGVQHNQVFYPPHIAAKEMIDAGRLGSLIHVRLRLGIGGKYGGWRSDPAVAGGGLLFDAGVHRFYLARFLGGEIRELRSMTDRTRSQGEDQAVVILRFENGALGVIDVNYHGPQGMFDDSVEIVGSEGALYISGCEAEFEGFRTGPALRRFDGAWHDERVEPGNWADSVRASIAAFVSAVRHGQQAPVPLSEGRRIVELIEEAHSSAIDSISTSR